MAGGLTLLPAPAANRAAQIHSASPAGLSREAADYSGSTNIVPHI
jgi:hypothetical protein